MDFSGNLKQSYFLSFTGFAHVENGTIIISSIKVQDLQVQDNNPKLI